MSKKRIKWTGVELRLVQEAESYSDARERLRAVAPDRVMLSEGSITGVFTNSKNNPQYSPTGMFEGTLDDQLNHLKDRRTAYFLMMKGRTQTSLDLYEEGGEAASDSPPEEVRGLNPRVTVTKTFENDAGYHVTLKFNDADTIAVLRCVSIFGEDFNSGQYVD